jgi:hypothetical protein
MLARAKHNQQCFGNPCFCFVNFKIITQRKPLQHLLDRIHARLEKRQQGQQVSIPQTCDCANWGRDEALDSNPYKTKPCTHYTILPPDPTEKMRNDRFKINEGELTVSSCEHKSLSLLRTKKRPFWQCIRRDEGCNSGFNSLQPCSGAFQYLNLKLIMRTRS